MEQTNTEQLSNKDQASPNQVLWQGKVAVKWFIFSKTRYGVVTKNRIVIRKKEREDSKEVANISKGDVVSLEFPKYGAAEALLTGYRSFVVKYKDGEKVKKLSFWAKGFGGYPNKEEMEKLVEAISVFKGEFGPEVTKSAEAFTFGKYMLVVIPIMAGFSLASCTGGIIMGIGGGVLRWSSARGTRLIRLLRRFSLLLYWE